MDPDAKFRRTGSSRSPRKKASRAFFFVSAIPAAAPMAESIAIRDARIFSMRAAPALRRSAWCKDLTLQDLAE